jgi:hypothetical protein
MKLCDSFADAAAFRWGWIQISQNLSISGSQAFPRDLELKSLMNFFWNCMSNKIKVLFTFHRSILHNFKGTSSASHEEHLEEAPYPSIHPPTHPPQADFMSLDSTNT